MLVEWELTLDCQNKCPYCTNGRNNCLKNPIKCETRTDVLKDFIKDLHKKYSDIDIFLFGGEPSFHPRFEFILNELNLLKQPYTIQTNFQNPKLPAILEKTQNEKRVQVSVHRTQIRDTNTYFKKLLANKKFIKRIDIMYMNRYDELLYDKWNKFFDCIQLTPVSYFETPHFKNAELKEQIKKSLAKYIEVHRLRSSKCEKSYRCYFWWDMLNGDISTKNKPCLYKNDYILFAPDLKQYNCSHRLNTDICPNESCFLMDFNPNIVSKL